MSTESVLSERMKYTILNIRQPAPPLQGIPRRVIISSTRSKPLPRPDPPYRYALDKPGTNTEEDYNQHKKSLSDSLAARRMTLGGGRHFRKSLAPGKRLDLHFKPDISGSSNTHLRSATTPIDVNLPQSVVAAAESLKASTSSPLSTSPQDPTELTAQYQEYTPPSDLVDSVIGGDKNEGAKPKKKKKKEITQEELQEMELVRQRLDILFKGNPQARSEYNNAALKIQCKFRQYLAFNILKERKRRKYQRQKTADELLSTERSYVDSLRVLREVYLLPLKEKVNEPKPIINIHQLRTIFSHIEIIYNVNVMFLQGCEKSLQSYEHTTSISKLFDGFTHYFKTYTDYCNNFDNSTAMLKYLKQNNTEFAQLLSKMDRDSRTSRLGLQSYLILPIQRIPRYRLLLQDLVKRTDPWHYDFNGIKKALSEILDVAEHLNSAMKKIESSQQMWKIKQQFQGIPDNFDLTEPHRRFIRDESLKILPDQAIHVHLFNDVLVVSKKRGEKFQFKSKFDLSQTRIYDYVCNTDTQDPYRFKVKDISDEQEIICADEQQKTEWLVFLYQTIQQAKSLKKAKDLDVNVDTSNDKSTFMDALEDQTIEENLDPHQCIEEMKGVGATFLKYCRKGRPHFRHFHISRDETELSWGSPNKRSSDSKVVLKIVTEIRVGQETDLFKKYPNKDVESLSFSIIYGKTKQRTLDLVASDRREFSVWVTGLRYLLENGPRAADDVNAHSSPQVIRNVEKSKFNDKFQEIGDAYSWGQCTRGSTGHGNQEDVHIPQVMKDFLYLDVQSVYCDDSVAFAVMTNGALFSWGAGKCGRSGHGDESDRLKPTRVESFRSMKVSSVAIGNTHTIVLLQDGSVYSMGVGENGQLGLGSDTGKNLFHEPQKLTSLKQKKIVQIASGSQHCAAISSSGEMFVWGRNVDGECGLGHKQNVYEPTLVEYLKDECIVACALGGWHTLALTKDGRVFCWGDATNGQLGLGPIENSQKSKIMPYVIPKEYLPVTATQVACGASHSAAIGSDGTVWTWGSGIYGQLGTGQKTNSFEPVCVQDLEQNPCVHVCCGVNHTIVLTESNQVFAWGAGTYGRLGIDSELDQPNPKEVEFLQQKVVRQIAAGGCMSMCVCAHQWVPDDDVKKCMKCNKDFTFMRRRHHCRYCGGLFCGTCSAKKITLLRFGFDSKVRVCGNCYMILKTQSV